MKKLFLTASLSLFVSWAAIAQSQLNKTFSGVKRIQINTASGDCTIGKASSSSVTVDLSHTYGNNYNPEIRQDGDRLVIKEKFRSNSSKGESLWKLSVPDGVEVDFATGSGNLKVTDLAMDLKVNTGSGDISVQRLKGDLRGNTGSGHITLTETNGEIKVNAGSGDIEANKVTGELSLNCGSGDISIMESQASFSANTGSGKIKGTNLILTGSSRFNTGSGNAQVVLASAPAHDISLNSGSGDAILDFKGNKIEGLVVMKANKKNGVIKAPFEFDKTEEIEQGGGQVVIKKTAQRGTSEVKVSIGTGSGVAQIK